jgi:hypothetical protein
MCNNIIVYRGENFEIANFYYIDGVYNTSVERLTYLEEPQILSHKCLKALIENSLEFDGCIIFVLLVTFEIFKFFGYGIKVNKSLFCQFDLHTMSRLLPLSLSYFKAY